MYLEHLINKVLGITATHLFTSRQLPFSKHVFLCCVRAEGGSPEPLGSLWAAVGTGHLHGALQGCPGLLVSSFLWPLGLPLQLPRKGGKSFLQVEETWARLENDVLCDHGRVGCPLCVLVSLQQNKGRARPPPSAFQ